MSETKQEFSASLAKDAIYKTGLRSFMEYRDLGIDAATHGQFRAHVIRIKKESAGHHDLHTTGLHQHNCDFQMFYVLNGWIKFVYEGQGEKTFRKGDCVLQPAGDRAQRARVLRRPRGARDLLAGRSRDGGRGADARDGRRGAVRPRTPIGCEWAAYAVSGRLHRRGEYLKQSFAPSLPPEECAARTCAGILLRSLVHPSGFAACLMTMRVLSVSCV